MKTVICLEQTPLPLSITRLSPWRPSTPNPTTIKHQHFPKRSFELHAKAKGFNSTPANIKEQNGIRKKSNNNNANGDEDDDDKIPDVVLQRMILRILINVGVPLVTGIALLQGFSVVKEQNLWEVPRWLPFLTTLITFTASALGIAYGTLSASWDEKKKGSLLGFEEAQKNWVEMWREDEESNRFKHSIGDVSWYITFNF